MKFAGRLSVSVSKLVFLDASKFVRGASASSVRWRGIASASAVPSPTPPASTLPETKKTRKKVSKDERKAMVLAFVNKYRAMNSGKYPTPSDAKNEVGGSYYFVRRIVQELEYEWKMKGVTPQEKDVSIGDDLTSNIKELQKSHLPLNKEYTGAQINATTFKDLEAVDAAGTSNVGEMTLLHGMESASMMRKLSVFWVQCKKAEVDLKEEITTIEDEPKFDNLMLAEQQRTGVDFEDFNIQHIEEELGLEMSVDKTMLNDIANTSECDARESNLLAMEARHLFDSQSQNTEVNLNEVTSAEDRLKLDSVKPLDQQQQLTGTVPMGLRDCSIQHHEAELRTETSIPIEKTPLNDIENASGYNSKYATGESQLQAMEVKHVMDSHPEKLMDNLNKEIYSRNDLKFDGWKPLVEEQQPSEIQKFTRELPNEKKDGRQHKDKLWQNLKSFADGIISFWRKL